MSELQLLQSIYRTDLCKFAERAMKILEPGTELQTGWHHQAIAFQLNRAAKREIRRLLINQPPKTLKTHLISVAYVAWLLMHNPTLKIAIISYDEALASKQLRSIRQILADPFLKELAPATKVKAGKDTEFVFETTAGGEVRAFSVRGGITGYGFDFIVVDDPIKANNASSETERKSLEEAFSSAMASRWRDPSQGVLIVVMQRLHIDDFSDFVKRIMPETVHLTIPAIAPEDISYEIAPGKFHVFRKGKLLEPDRLSLSYLNEMRLIQGSAHFEAQYLQDPQASGGTIVRSAWLKYYKTPRKPDFTIMSVDPAFSDQGGNHTAVLVANFIDSDVEIIHGELAQLDYIGLINLMRRLDREWKPDVIFIEAIGAGTGLRFHLAEYDIRHVVTITSHGGKSKVERMEIVSPIIEAGHLWLPEEAPWQRPLLKSLVTFPFGPSHDWPDALSQLLRYKKELTQQAMYHRNRRFPPPPPPQRFRSGFYHRQFYV